MSSAVERPELVDLGAREQRRVDLEVGVLGRRADQRQQPLLDRGQQRVLLGLVEAVDLVEEEDRRPARRAALLGPRDHLADLGAAGVDRRELLEGAARPGGDDPRQRRLAGAGRAVEDGAVRLAGLDRDPQRRARAEQVPWPANSSRSRGRMRVARGASGGGASGGRSRLRPHARSRRAALFVAVGHTPSIPRRRTVKTHRRALKEPGESAARGRRGRPVRAAVAGDDRPRVGSDRRPRVRRAARPYRDAAGAGLDRGWMTADRFEDAIAACNLLPGPASTQLAIYSAWSLRGTPGALVGGDVHPARPPPDPGTLGAVPGLAAGLGPWRRRRRRRRGGGGGGPAGIGLIGPSREMAHRRPLGRLRRRRSAAAATLGAWVVLVLLGAGIAEVLARRAESRRPGTGSGQVDRTPGRCWSRCPCSQREPAGWGALLDCVQGRGPLIRGRVRDRPVMQRDAVEVYEWMSGAEFLNAVALGQVTPGPVTHTIAVVGYAAAGMGGALLATAVPSPPRSSWSSAALATSRHCERTGRPRPSSGARDLRPSGRSWGSRCRWRWPSTRPGSGPSSRPRRYHCSCCGSVSSRPCCARAHSGPGWPLGGPLP